MADERAIRSWISDEESVPVSLRQKGNAPLQLFRGPEEKINLVDFEDGRLFVSTDTRKIYLDSYVTNVYGDKESKRLSLGGNNGIYYGIKTFSELEETQAAQTARYQFVYDPESEYHSFDLSAKDIPQTDDLILNVDGCFYRVAEVIRDGEYVIYNESEEEGSSTSSVPVQYLIIAAKLTIAGSGGGGGGGYAQTVAIRRDPNHNGNILLAEGKLEVGFLVTDTQVDSEYVTVNVTVRGKNTVQAIKRVPVNTGLVQKVDLYRYRAWFTTNSANMVTIQVVNDYGSTASYTYSDIRPINVYLEAVGATTLPPVYTDTAVITFKPYGGSAMWRWDLHYEVKIPGFSEVDHQVEENISSTYDNGQAYSKSFLLREIYGNYNVKVYMRAYPDPESTDDQGNLLYIDSDPLMLSFQHLSGDTAAVSISTDKMVYNQFDTAAISYQAMYQEGTTILCRLTVECNGTQVAQLQPTVAHGDVRTWTVALRQAGTYTVTIEAVEFPGVSESVTGIIVEEAETSIPVINEDDANLQLYYTAAGKDNNAIDKDQWENKGTVKNITPIFEHFNWNGNGWMVDSDNATYLHMNNGAKLTIPFAVFAKENCHSSNYGAMGLGKTIELDFKLSNVRDPNAILIDIASWSNKVLNHGIVGLGEKICINTNLAKNYRTLEEEAQMSSAQIASTNGLRAYLTTDKRVNVTFAIQPHNSIPVDPTHPREFSGLIYTYIDGVISGITGFKENDKICDVDNAVANEHSYLIFDSTYADIDLYNIRVYNQFNSDTIILNNYFADLPTVADKLAAQKNNDVLNGGYVDLGKVADLGNIPYVVFTDCRETDDKKGSGGITGDSIRLPNHKKDFRWAPFYYVDPEDALHENDSAYIPRSIGGPQNLVNAVIYAQGTSSLQYPVKNLRMRIKDSAQAYSLRPAIPPADENDTYWEHVPPVQLFTFKADYMDSSLSHNTGTANILNALYNDSKITTPAQQYYPENTLVTAIVGRPVIAFYQPYNSETAQYIGRYNFDLDKAEQAPFGFVPNYADQYGVLTDNMYYDFNDSTYKNKLVYGGNPIGGFMATQLESKDWEKKGYASKTFYTSPINDPAYEWTGNGSETGDAMKNYFKKAPLYEYKTGTGSKDFVSTIQCWEFLNNASTLCRFVSSWDEATDLGYEVEYNPDGSVKTDAQGNPVYVLDENDERIIASYMPNWVGAFEARYPEYETQQGSDKRGFARFVNWVASTNQNTATGNSLPAPVTYHGVTYNNDTKAYRLAKFVNEFDQYMIKDFTIFYYIVTEALLLVDSRSKNMMMCSYDVDMEHGTGHWFPIFYDMDTALGVDNNGILKFPYDVDDETDMEAFNGRANYGVNTVVNGISHWEENPAYNVLWCNLREGFAEEIAAMYRSMRAKGHFNVRSLLEMYNDQQADAFAKIYDNKDAWYKYVKPLTEVSIVMGESGEMEEQYGVNWVHAGQGTRSLHREYFLRKRFQMLDGKYGMNQGTKDISFRFQGSDSQNELSSLFTPKAIPWLVEKNPDGTDKRDSQGNLIYILDENNERQLDPTRGTHTRQFQVTSSSTQYVTNQFVGGGTILSKLIEAETPTYTNIAPNIDAETYTDTEAYLYDLGDIYDIGDLSDKFPKEITINKEVNLRRLTVGDPDPAYHNRGRSLKISGLALAKKLEELDLRNVELSNDTLSVASTPYFRRLYAKGSTLTGITLPNGGNVEYLQLPATLTFFILQNNIHFDNINTPENFSIEGVSVLRQLVVENCPLFNTQQLVTMIREQDPFITEGSVDTPQITQGFSLPDVEWTFDPINHPEDFEITNGVITDIKLLKYVAQTLRHDPWGELFNGQQGTLIQTNNRNFGGVIHILNGTDADANHIGIDSLSLQRYYTDAFPNLRLDYAENSENVSGYQIKVHDTARDDSWTTDSVLLSRAEASNFDFETYLQGVQRPTHVESSTDTYAFAGWSTIGYVEQADYEDNYEAVLAQYVTYPFDPTTSMYDIGDDATIGLDKFNASRELHLYPVWVKSRRTFTATFWGKPRADLTVDDEPIDVQQVPYLGYATVPEDVPVNIVLNPNDVADTQIGLLTEYVRDDSERSFQILANTNFYPVFAPLQQAATITNPPIDYFTASPVPRIELENGTLTPANGVCATINASCTAKAVVVPLTLDGNPVITIKNESPYVERIYFEKDREQDGTSNILFFGNDDSGFAIPDPDQNYMYLPNSTLHYIDFGACQKLINIGLSGSANTFARCVNLEVRSLPNSLMYIGGHAFKQCTSITSITIPTDLLVIDNFAFYYCTGLTSLDLSTPISRDASTLATALNGGLSGNYANYYPRIGQSAFDGCSNLQLSDNAAKGTWRFVSIGQSAFQNCTSLQCFNSSEAASNSGALLYLGNQVFMNDRNLGLTNLPNNLIYIGAQAFMLGDGLNKVGIAITGLPQRLRGIGSSAFANTYISTDLNGYNLQWTLGDNESYPDQMAEDAFASFWIRRLFITLSETASYVSINNGFYQMPDDFQNRAPWQACKMDVENNVITKYYTMAEMNADAGLRANLWKYSNNPGD